MNGLTAASRDLPNGALVRVTYLRTGRSRVIRINDRGPYIPGRDIDLSFRTAALIGITETGIGRVRLELLEVPKEHWPLKRADD